LAGTTETKEWHVYEQQGGALWPTARTHHSACRVGSEVWYFGGLIESTTPSSELYAFCLGA